jgi:N6-adenosine-specific RNA methylase IME4
LPKPQSNPQFPPFPEGEFDVLLADPPWNYQNWTDAKNGAADSAFETLSVEDIASLLPQIDEVAADNSALCLWTTFPKLKQGLYVMEAWNYKFLTCLFDWTKTYREPVKLPFTPELKAALAQFMPEEDLREFLKPSRVKSAIVLGEEGRGVEVPLNQALPLIPEDQWAHFVAPGVQTVTVIPGNEYCGLGFYTRSNNEICLLGIRGRLPRTSKNVRMSILSKRRKHSVKPDCQYERIMELWPDKRYLELFARVRYNDQWIVWGDEAPEE